MATLNILEFSDLYQRDLSELIEVQTIAFGQNAQAATAPFNVKTRSIRIVSSETCWITFSNNADKTILLYEQQDYFFNIDRQRGFLTVIQADVLPDEVSSPPFVQSVFEDIFVDSVQFDTTLANGPISLGQLRWNTDDDTLNVGMMYDSVLQIGEETFYHVENVTGSTILNGTLCSYGGTVGNSGKLRITPWTGTISPESTVKIMGVATTDIPNGGTGYLTYFGKVRGIDCSGATENETWANGDILYPTPIRSPFGVYGLTNIPPESPNTKSAIAVVVSNHDSNGTLFVRPTLSSSLARDELVNLDALANNDLLVYNDTTERFENSSSLDLSSLKVGDGVTNYSEFEADGTLVAKGSATTWLDIDFPIIVRTTGPNIPTLATLVGNLTVPQWEIGDYFQCEGQEMIHAWKEGSDVYWHLHLITNGQEAVSKYCRFEIQIAYGNVGSQIGNLQTITSPEFEIPANTPDRTHLILPIDSSSMTGITIGTQVYARLERIASTIADPVDSPFCTMLQMHIECDTIGSRQITSK